ncbi:hypothetical protein [Pedomonas sp. V897]|uniref:hypothetical protein n=1 Tax=Pedomonas sp. V897 TaxID=3446482 RepID=UPI003EE10386
MTALTKDTLFRPTPSRSETRAEITDRTAREIIQSETERSRAKTERLRAARLEQEARALAAAAAEPAPKSRARKPARSR